jgi:selenocysteine-specific elongation factor
MAKLIGTAGHVDHGKTTLIRALTGIDADRLPEEKQRGMTIDIGFAFLDLEGIGRVSIVDVPGHERFVTNMLVGALGIDVALLCVAADEGVKPQTREHLQILDLLPVDRMVVALTRSDIADNDTRELATLEVEELLANNRFKGSPVVEVSAVTGLNIDKLKEELARALSDPSQPSAGPWYLPIDRVFAVKGHGCVVTGTLAQGTVKVGSAAYLEPGHQEVRVRGIHSHEEPLESGEKGRRIALNLSGVKVEEVHRGQAIGEPGALFETTIFDAAIRWAGPHKHGQRVRVSVGAEEVIGTLFLNNENPKIVQLRLEHPIACALEQPLILRRYSPPDVIGGGTVLVPQAKPRKKSHKVEEISRTGSDADAINALLGDNPKGVATEEICRVLGRTAQQLGDEFEKLSMAGQIKGFAGVWFSSAGYRAGADKFLAALVELHDQNPTLAGVPRERIVERAGLGWQGKPLDRILASLATEERLVVQGTAVRLPQFKVQLSPKQRVFLDRVLSELDKAGINVPNSHELARALTVPPQAIEEILKLGVQSGELVRVADELFYSHAQLEDLKKKVKQVSGGKPFGAGTFRDALGTSRRYAIPLLEYFDSIRFTLRVGDERVVVGEGRGTNDERGTRNERG